MGKVRESVWDKCYEMDMGDVVVNYLPIDIERLIRVPGGWIYYRQMRHEISSVFVPFSNEFMMNVKTENIPGWEK